MKHLNDIKAKCEQYWNESGINDAEIHATLECIYKSCLTAEAVVKRLVTECELVVGPYQFHVSNANPNYCGCRLCTCNQAIEAAKD